MATQKQYRGARGSNGSVIARLVFLVIAIAAIICLILEFFTAYKPSNGFRKASATEQTETVQGNGGSEESALIDAQSGVELTADNYVSPYAVTYADTDTITPPCEHLPETVDNIFYGASHGWTCNAYLTLTAREQPMTFHIMNRATGGALSEYNVYFAEYTGGGTSYYYTTGMWCFHGIRSYFMSRYGHFYTNFEIDWNYYKFSSDWDKIKNKPTVKESYDPETDTLTLRVDGVFYYATNTPEPHCHFPTSISFYADEAKYVPLPPEKEGYTFTGWYTDEACTNLFTGTIVTSDITLYAGWRINTYTVTFESNGGSAIESQTVNWNTAASLTTPTRDGYGFGGWYLPSGTQYTDQAIRENTVLTAQWYRNRFNVTFNANGGSEAENQTVSLNESVSLPDTTKLGYNFLGWYLSDGTQYTDQPVTDDIRLTARWEIKTYTVTFMVDGAVYQTVTVEYGTKLICVTESAEPALYALYSVDEAGISLAADYAIESDITVYAEEGTTAQKLKGNWKRITVCVVCGSALLVSAGYFISALARQRKNR